MSEKTKHDLRKFNLLKSTAKVIKVREKNDSWSFGDYFEQVQISTVCKIVLFCGGIDAIKVVNGRCTAMLCNVTKVCSSITLNKSYHTNSSFATQNLGRSYRILPTSISNMTYPNQQKEKLAQLKYCINL